MTLSANSRSWSSSTGWREQQEEVRNPRVDVARQFFDALVRSPDDSTAQSCPEVIDRPSSFGGLRGEQMVERSPLFGDEHVGVVADLDLGDVAPYPIAVSFKDFTLARVVIHAHVETHVADVGLGRDGPQQVSLAVAADQDSRAWFLHPAEGRRRRRRLDSNRRETWPDQPTPV